MCLIACSDDRRTTFQPVLEPQPQGGLALDSPAQGPPGTACLLLGFRSRQGGGDVGTGLFNHALARSVSGAALIGGRALVVNAVDEEAASFWHHRGFLPSKDDALVLFRSMADIAASLTAAETQ